MEFKIKSFRHGFNYHLLGCCKMLLSVSCWIALQLLHRLLSPFLHIFSILFVFLLHFLFFLLLFPKGRSFMPKWSWEKPKGSGLKAKEGSKEWRKDGGDEGNKSWGPIQQRSNNEEISWSYLHCRFRFLFSLNRLL